MPSLRFSVVIQAGGESSRMGADKGLLPLQDRSLVQHILDQVNAIGDETIIISNRPKSYSHFGYPVFQDVYPGKGSLGGLYSAIFYSKEPFTLVLACDMPFVNRSFLNYLIQQAPDFDAVVPRIWPQDFVEPFPAIYSKSCLPSFLADLTSNRLRISDALKGHKVRYVDLAEIEEIAEPDRLFFNVNEREDLERAAHMLNQ
jgi:molybdopterin-guanine dinucleotide biosynthesis protein A